MHFNNDNDCIAAIKQGNHKAYTYLVNKYKDMAFNIALKLTKNVQDSEDAVQESFIKAYNKLGGFQFESKFSTWLYTIVYRTTVYYLRRNTLNTQSLEEIDTEKLTEQECNQLSNSEKQQFIAAVIEKLPPMESLLITLYYLNDNSIDEIKAITALSKTNIKVKLFRARKKLAKKLKHLLKDEIKDLVTT